MPYVEEQPETVSNNISLEIERIGDLKSLSWIETPETLSQGLKIEV